MLQIVYWAAHSLSSGSSGSKSCILKWAQLKEKKKKKMDVFPLWEFCHSPPSSCLSGRVKDSHVVSPGHFSGESHPLLLL